MGKAATNGVLDGTLDVIAAFPGLALCAGQPADPSAIASAALATETMTGGDYTKAAGDVSGRKVTVGAKSGVSVTTGGDIDHVVLYNPANVLSTDDMYVTTCASRTVIPGDSVNVAAFDIENRAPT